MPDHTFLIKITLLIILVSILLYVLRELLRQSQAIKVEKHANTLRLAIFEKQLQYESERISISKVNTLNAWVGTRKFQLDEIVSEADNICSFYLTPHDGKPLPSFKPGQYLTFKMDITGHDRPVVRCYSLSDSPLQRDRYRVTIKLMAPPPKQKRIPFGLLSNHFLNVLKQGDILDCKSPQGNFCLDMSEHSPIILIGGGIGITPLLSMLSTVSLSSSKRETWLFYGVRNKAEAVQLDYLKQLQQEHENIHIQLCFSEPEKRETLGKDFDHKGYVSVQLMSEVLPSMNYDFYVCGPPPMMTSITEDLTQAKVPDNKIHYESFGPASINKTMLKEGVTNEEYSITFAKSDKKLLWRQDCGTILEFAESNGIVLDSGCRAGSCGSCAIAVREGSVDYLEEIDAELESGSCLACLAIPKEELVLDA